MASGSATMPTMTPAVRSAENCVRSYVRSVVTSCGTSTTVTEGVRERSDVSEFMSSRQRARGAPVAAQADELPDDGWNEGRGQNDAPVGDGQRHDAKDRRESGKVHG